MSAGIQIVWWIGLIGALLITLVILREVELVLRVLRDLDRLSVFTRNAAEGIVRNVEIIPSLANVAGPAQNIREGAKKLAQTTGAIEQKLAGFITGSSIEGGHR